MIGIDLVEIRRFRTVLRTRKNRFIENTFSSLEQAYCSSYKDAAPHYAGTFAAKEAVRKTSAKYLIPMKEIEIRRASSGAPSVWIGGKQVKSLYISITHGKRDAIAVAVHK